MASNSFKVGTEVRVSNQSNIPVRYQGRSGVVVGRTTSTRGASQYLVSFGSRRATPLPLNTRQFRVI